MAQYHITIDPAYKSKVEEIAKEFSGGNKSKLIEAMIDYFDYYKLNPNEREVNLDSKFASFERKINSVRDIFVSFIREMENKKIEPMITQVNQNTMALLKFLKEDALTKDDLASFSGSGTRRVALFENKEKAASTETTLNSETNVTDDDITAYKKRANVELSKYKEYFSILIKSVSRKNDKGDYLFISAINEFQDKIKSIEKVVFTGTKTSEAYNAIESVESVLRTIDNYCDEFLLKGESGTGKDKLFHIHTISEYRIKFENLNIV